MTDSPVTVITGGSRGIGAATALHLAAQGHRVALTYRRDRSSAARLVDEIIGNAGRALAVRADVTREGDVDELFTTAAAELGPVTGVVNSAGLTGHIGDLADTPVDAIRQVIDVNFLGVVLCCRRAAQAMSPRSGGRGGAIVNVSSAAATLGSAHEYVHYAGAKAAVDAVTVGLAQELAADDIRVNAVAPGIIRTGIHADAGDPSRADRVGAAVPLGRAGEPQDVAAAIAWLLGPEASYVSGAVLRVAGGR